MNQGVGGTTRDVPSPFIPVVNTLQNDYLFLEKQSKYYVRKCYPEYYDYMKKIFSVKTAEGNTKYRTITFTGTPGKL
jgi:hypothetical protein